jgi:histone H2A
MPNKGFALSIIRLLKTLSPYHGIISNTKQQLDNFLHILAQLLADTAYVIHKPKTITSYHIEVAVRILFSDDMLATALSSEELVEVHFADMLINTAKNVEEKFQNFQAVDNKHISKQNKAGIIFAPSTAEKFLRNTGANMVTKNAPVFLASILQSICSSFLEVAIRVANDVSRIRLSTRDLQVAMRNHDSIRRIFEKYKIQFIGGGVILEKPIKLSFLQKRDNGIQDIKKYQKAHNYLLIPKLSFCKNVRSCVSKLTTTPPKIAEKAFITLQYYLEQYLVSFLKDTNMICNHAGRVKITANDMDLLKRIRRV